MSRIGAVVTGLHASGKFSVGKQIADALQFVIVDKDNYLECFFYERGIGGSLWR